MAIQAANDNKPQQINVTGHLRHEGVWFPAYDLAEFIEYDLKFGRAQPEYPISEDTRLQAGGTAIKFFDHSGRQAWAAVIPESGDNCYAEEWRVELYRYKSEAYSALERAQSAYVVCDYDDVYDDDYEDAA
ncbi:hypothetical protein EET67_05100 [Pseudaminobacter arsenicus]|uniref:Uncharacterized protein n=1 Tax=Borborobacter arsenicus TaxID=1851146 RepID=A0A432VA18_9HYPH|nr:hypothetical protein [Pseudaminobacter arsenicus]RUM99019.1 hypothetical protein EET67_05100 [Pseudaminobacter arsenicus]